MISFPKTTIPVFIHMLTRNGCNQVTIAGYQRMLSDTVEKYFKPTGQGYNELFEQGMVVVYLNCTTELFNVPKPSESLTCKMYLSGIDGPVIRFELNYYHDDGTLAFVSVLHCAIFKIAGRKLERHPEEYIDFNYFNKGEKVIDADSRCSFEFSSFEYVSTTTAKPSWIDASEHVDNVRYFEMAYDCLSKEQRNSMDRVHRTEVYFLHEILEGQEIILKKKNEGSKVVVAGFIDKNCPTFALSIEFNK